MGTVISEFFRLLIFVIGIAGITVVSSTRVRQFWIFIHVQQSVLATLSSWCIPALQARQPPKIRLSAASTSTQRGARRNGILNMDGSSTSRSSISRISVASESSGSNSDDDAFYFGAGRRTASLADCEFDLRYTTIKSQPFCDTSSTDSEAPITSASRVVSLRNLRRLLLGRRNSSGSPGLDPQRFLVNSSTTLGQSSTKTVPPSMMMRPTLAALVSQHAVPISKSLSQMTSHSSAGSQLPDSIGARPPVVSISLPDDDGTNAVEQNSLPRTSSRFHLSPSNSSTLEKEPWGFGMHNALICNVRTPDEHAASEEIQEKPKFSMYPHPRRPSVVAKIRHFTVRRRSSTSSSPTLAAAVTEVERQQPLCSGA